jgi:hypothetical protein
MNNPIMSKKELIIMAIVIIIVMLLMLLAFIFSNNWRGEREAFCLSQGGVAYVYDSCSFAREGGFVESYDIVELNGKYYFKEGGK